MSEKNYLEDFRDFTDSLYKESDIERPKSIVIVDGLNLFIRNFQAVPTINYNGDHVGGALGFFRGIMSAMVYYNPDRIYVVFDGKGGSSRRRKMYSAYKSKVLSSGTFNRFSDTRGLIDETSSQRTQVLTMLKALTLMPIRVISLDYVEADDVISCLCREIIGDDYLKFIISTDKDYLQLINKTTSVYNHDKKELITESNMPSMYGYTPLNYLTYRCFSGDRSDNIPGVKQVGDAGLIKHFNLNNTERHVTLQEIFDISEKNLRDGAKPKIFQNIIEQKQFALINYKLMQLQDVDISNIIKSNIKALYEQPLPKLKSLELEKIFNDIELCKSSFDFLIWEKNLKRLTQ
jgi:DNA polymerase I